MLEKAPALPVGGFFVGAAVEQQVGAQLVLEDLTEAERKALAQCRHAVLGVERPLRLDCGVELGPYRIAYQTYGSLNAEK